MIKIDKSYKIKIVKDGDNVKNKGFTMVELLGVFTITVLILVAAVPSILSMIKKGNDQEYQRFLKDVSIACEAYVEDQNIHFENSISVTITMGDLINSKFLKSTLVNPKNNKKVLDNSNLEKKIIITKDEDGIINCNLES